MLTALPLMKPVAANPLFGGGGSRDVPPGTGVGVAAPGGGVSTGGGTEPEGSVNDEVSVT